MNEETTINAFLHRVENAKQDKQHANALVHNMKSKITGTDNLLVDNSGEESYVAHFPIPFRITSVSGYGVIYIDSLSEELYLEFVSLVEKAKDYLESICDKKQEELNKVGNYIKEIEVRTKNE